MVIGIVLIYLFLIHYHQYFGFHILNILYWYIVRE